MSDPIKFEIGVRMNMRDLVPKAKEVEDSVNDTMQSFGFSEKMRVTTVLPMELSVAQQPTAAEWESFKAIIIQTFREQYGFAEIEYVKER